MKAAEWIPLDARFYDNAKIRAAGRNGREVFIYVLCVNRIERCDGTLPAPTAARHLIPVRLAAKLGLTEQEAAEGLDRCAALGVDLVTKNGDGSVSIVGWNDEWWPAPTSTERSRKRRARCSIPDPEQKIVESRGATLCNVACNNQSDLFGEAADKTVTEGGAMHRSEALALWSLQESLRTASIPRTRRRPPTESNLRLIIDRLTEGYTVQDCEHVLRVYAGESRSHPDKACWFNGETNWRPANFNRALGQPDPGSSNPRPCWEARD